MARWSKRQSQPSGRALGITNSPNPTGDDGQWYAFEVEVGTPPITVRLMVSTSTTGLWLVHPLGCSGAGPTCQDLRGALYAVYHNNGSGSVTSTSSTYESTTPLQFLTVADAGIGLPYSPREAAIGYSANSLSGTDNITLSLGSDGAGPALDTQTIFSYTANTPYVGQLGLWNVGYQVNGFTYPTILDSLVTDKYIPSATYAYTAGNIMDTASPSLVLGGYDALRIGPQSVSVPFGDQGALAVSVSAMTATNDTSTNALMSDGPITMYIDSMVPEIWLPESIYTRFQDVYGIRYDNGTGRYTISADQESELRGWNITLTMTIGSPSGGSTVNISLPYSAFDQTASPPYIDTADNSQTYYFPIRQATNSTNLILGRTFLQSAYLLTQNDLQTFNLSQAQVPSDQTQRNLIALDPTGAEISSDSSPVNGSQADGAGGNGGTSSGGGSNAGAIGGGVAGGVIAALLIILLGYFFWYRPRQRRRQEQTAKESKSTSPQPDSEPRGDSPADAATQGPWPTAVDEKNAQSGRNAEDAHEMGSGDATQDDRVHEMYVEPAEVEDTSRKPEVAGTTDSPIEDSPVTEPESTTITAKDTMTETAPKVENKD